LHFRVTSIAKLACATVYSAKIVPSDCGDSTRTSRRTLIFPKARFTHCDRVFCALCIHEERNERWRENPLGNF
jgi:hypothetical protein